MSENVLQINVCLKSLISYLKKTTDTGSLKQVGVEIHILKLKKTGFNDKLAMACELV